MPEISVILPVYNVEKYLKQCLDSIKHQTFTDFECLCINDGATDNSLSILEDFVLKDSRFKIISQTNSGLSAARNTGIKAAVSTYLTFIDSDDYIAENYLETLYNTAIKENADIVRSSYKFYFHDQDTYKSAKIRAIHGIKDCSNDAEKLRKGYAGAFAWGKLYKTALLKKNDILFYEGRMSEDCPFCAMAFLYAKQIIFLKDEIYFYRKHGSSLSASRKEQGTLDDFYNFISLTQDLIMRNFKENSFFSFYINVFIYKFASMHPNLSLQKQKIILTDCLSHLNYLFSHKEKLSCSNKLKLFFAIRIINLFGYKSLPIFRALKNFL